MCTGIRILSKQRHPFWGRTQDFEQDFDYAGIKIPAGSEISSASTPFRTKLAVMGIVWAKDVHKNPVVLDGINEQGICGGSFYFDHWFRYAPREKIVELGKIALRGEELVTWILTRYSSLDEIIARLNDDIGIVDGPGPMLGMSVPQHAVFQDETGRSIVVEPSITDGFQFFENSLGIFTNAPTFDWHISNVKMALERSTGRSYQYTRDEPITDIPLNEHTSGLVGVPSDYKPESRFMRAAYVKMMSLPVDDDAAVNEVFQLLTPVNTPKGALRLMVDHEMVVPWTQYTAVYDVCRKALYVHTYANRNIRRLEFGDSAEWDGVRYFRFVLPQTYEPFVEER